MRTRLYILSLLILVCSFLVISCTSDDNDSVDGDLENTESDGDTELEDDVIDGDDDLSDGDEAELEVEEEIEEEIDPTNIVFVPVNTGYESKETHAPKQIRVSYTGNPARSFAISWRTVVTDKTIYTPKVWFVKESEAGSTPEELPFSLKYTVEGDGVVYTTLFPEDEEAEEIELVNQEFVTWTVELKDLEPDTKYFYRAGSWEDVDFAAETLVNPDLTEVLNFTTAVEKGTRQPVRIVAAGDSRGGAADIKERIEIFTGVEADFWIFNGDLTTSAMQTEWFEWFDALGPLLKTTPFMSACGNHELNISMFSYDIFYNQFALPKIGEAMPPEFQERAWSFNYDNVHVVGLDTNTETMIEHYKGWLDQDLKKANEDPDIDWILVTFHQGAFSSCGAHGSTDYIQFHLTPIFEKHHVDMVFNGHDHTYERTCQIKHRMEGDERIPYCTEDGTGVTYFIVGGFFAPGYGPKTDWFTRAFEHGDKRNYVVLDIEGKTLDAVTYDGDGLELDRVSLSKAAK